MTAEEYKTLQERLSAKLTNNPYTSHKIQAAKQRQGYEEAILAAKSILHSFYKHQHGHTPEPDMVSEFIPRNW